jgi:membrane-bound lytic murein transglycosylase B
MEKSKNIKTDIRLNKMARLTSDAIASIKKYMRANGWVTKRQVCNAVGIDMLAASKYINDDNAKSRGGTRGVKEWFLVEVDRRLDGPPVEPYKPSIGPPVRAGGLDFKKIKSRGIG